MPRPWLRSAFNEVNDWALGISIHYEYYLIINTVLWNSKMEILFKDALLHILAQNNISKHFKNHEIYRLWDFPKYYIFFLHTHLQYLQFDKKKAFKSASKRLSNFHRFAPWDVENFVLQPAANPSMSH